MATDRELQAIVKELKELNRRLDRLCRASIFSLDEPAVTIKKEKHYYTNEIVPKADKD